MSLLNFSRSLVAGTKENINDVQAMFNEVRTVLNGQVAYENLESAHRDLIPYAKRYAVDVSWPGGTALSSQALVTHNATVGAYAWCQLYDQFGSGACAIGITARTATSFKVFAQAADFYPPSGTTGKILVWVPAT